MIEIFIDVYSDNQPRLISKESTNSSLITSPFNPSIELITTSNRSSTSIIRRQILTSNSIPQFSTSLIYSLLPFDNEPIRSWQLKINEHLLLTMSFDHFEKKLIIQDFKHNDILTMFYSPKHRLLSRNTRGFLPMTYTYRENDQKLSSWKLGPYSEEFLYDTRGRLIEIQRPNDLSSIKYSYGQGEQVNIFPIVLHSSLILSFSACWNHLWFSIEYHASERFYGWYHRNNHA